MKSWETLFARALLVLDCAESAGRPVLGWTFGGGSALMWRYRHRVSRGIDIFVPDPALLGGLSPRLNPAVESLTSDYVELAGFLQFCFPEGNLAFVASGSLTPHPFSEEEILGRPVRVETPAEIVAKKLSHRAARLSAGDLFDLAFVAERVPAALSSIQGVLALRRDDLLRCLSDREKALREDFEALETLDFRPAFDDCIRKLRALLARLPAPPRVEQEPASYRARRTVAVHERARAPKTQKQNRAFAVRERPKAFALRAGEGILRAELAHEADPGHRQAQQTTAHRALPPQAAMTPEIFRLKGGKRLEVIAWF